MMPGRTEELSKKEKYLKMRLKEKRAIYRCSKYITLIDIPTWHDYYRVKYLQKNNNDDFGPIQNDLNRKVSLFFGDITSLEVDAIVNSANKNLRGGLGGVCDVILKAANSDLLEECIALGGCNTGDAKITGGYMLPAKYIIHAVGPNIEDSHKLCSSYLKSLDRLLENKLKSIAFPCISTGLNGYRNDKAAKIALKTVKDWLKTKDNAFKVQRIIFCLYLQKDLTIYEELMEEIFPCEP